MQWHLRMAVGVAAAALLLPAAGPTASAEAMDERQLRQALLDHMDFPAEWAVDSERAAAERGIGVPLPEERSCRVLFQSGAKHSETAAFARSISGPFVTTTAAGHRTAGQAQRAVADFREAAERCAAFRTEEGAGTETALTVVYESAEADPELRGGLGDEAAAVRFERVQEAPEAPEVLAEAVLVRVGEHTVLVAQAGRDDQDTGSLRPLIDQAVEKLEEVAAGRTPSPAVDHEGHEL